MAKMIYRKDTGEILGVHIFGLHAADLIHEASNAVATRQSVSVRSLFGLAMLLYVLVHSSVEPKLTCWVGPRRGRRTSSSMCMRTPRSRRSSTSCSRERMWRAPSRPRRRLH